MKGIPTNVHPTTKKGRLQKKKRKDPLTSQMYKPNATPDTNQQMPNATKELLMRVVSVGFTIGSPGKLRQVDATHHCYNNSLIGLPGDSLGEKPMIAPRVGTRSIDCNGRS